MHAPSTFATILPGKGRWRARDVSYWSGPWDRLSALVPFFSLEPFQMAVDAPGNPYMKAVVRKPVNVTEHPIPVGTVSNTYQLVQHHEVVSRCFDGLRAAGVCPDHLECEVGLTALGEWINFRAYFPDTYNHVPKDGNPIRLRLECFNSVDGSSRLILLLGWYRLVCSNGLIIGETKAELKDIHDQRLNIDVIPGMIAAGLKKVQGDIARMGAWSSQAVDRTHLEGWVNGPLAKQWGKKAACRVYHICQTGHDVEILDPFAKGEATEKPVSLKDAVPGSATPAENLYDVCQVLSWVATKRSDTEQRLAWQVEIPSLVFLLSQAAKAA